VFKQVKAILAPAILLPSPNAWYGLAISQYEDKVIRSGGFKVGVARDKTKKGAPLMTSSYSANRDKHF